VAVSVYDPAAVSVVFSSAIPLLKVTAPNTVRPLVKRTLPVGVGNPALAATIAVKVML
jgi:hypothetical protein